MAQVYNTLRIYNLSCILLSAFVTKTMYFRDKEYMVKSTLLNRTYPFHCVFLLSMSKCFITTFQNITNMLLNSALL